MKLIRYEIKKCLSSKALIIFFIICLCVNFLICFSSAKRDNTFFGLKTVWDDFEKDPQSVKDYYEELEKQEKDFSDLYYAYFHGEISYISDLVHPYTYSGDPEINDYALLNKFFKDLNSDNFAHKMEKVIQGAEANKKELLSSYDNIDSRSFAYRKQDLISRTYENILNNTRLFPEMGYGWDILFEFDSINIFIIFFSMICGAHIFLSETDGNFLILHTTKHGRIKTSIAKLLTSATFTLLIVFSFTALSFTAIYLKCGGMSSLENSIAVFDNFCFIPYNITVKSFLLVYVLSKILLCLTCSSICILLCILIKNMAAGFVVSLAVLGVNYYIYIVALSPELKYFNLAGYACFAKTVSFVRCCNVGGYAVDLVKLVTVMLIILCCIFGAISILLYSQSRIGRKKRTRDLHELLLHRKKRKHKLEKKDRRCFSSIIFYEAKKTIFRREIMFIILSMLVIGIFMTLTEYTPRNNKQLFIYSDYIDKLSGDQTKEKSMFIEAEYDKTVEILSKHDEMRKKYYDGEIDGETLSIYIKDHQDASERINVLERLRSHSEYLDAVYEKNGINACYIYDIDLERIVSSRSNIMFVFAIVFVSVGLFSDEYIAGDSMKMLHSYKRGREYLFKKKIILSFGCSVAISVACILTEILVVVRNLKISNLDSPVLSLEAFYNTRSDVSIANFIIFVITLRIIFLTVIGLFSSSLGAVVKNKLYSIAILFFFILSPELMSRFGLDKMKYFSILNALDVKNIYLISTYLGGYWYMIAFYSAMIIFTALLICIAYKKFCKKKLWSLKI